MNIYDRRVFKTRESIVTAFLSLLIEKGFEHISVSDITKAADINRGTFYDHFMDKYQLLDWCMEEKMKELKSQCAFINGKITNKQAGIAEVFRYFEKEYTFYRAMLTK